MTNEPGFIPRYGGCIDPIGRMGLIDAPESRGAHSKKPPLRVAKAKRGEAYRPIGRVVVGHFVATRIKSTSEVRFYPLLHVGNRLVHAGNRSLHAGNRSLRVRRRSLRMGYCSLRTGNHFLRVGFRSLRVGNWFLRVGNHSLRMGRRSLHAFLPVNRDVQVTRRSWGTRSISPFSRVDILQSRKAAEDAGFMSPETWGFDSIETNPTIQAYTRSIHAASPCPLSHTCHVYPWLRFYQAPAENRPSR